MTPTLNEQQRRAVEYLTGPLLIVAGAGTGKTTVIVEKIKHIILEHKVKPEEILALTFTEKAASEMEERVDQAMPYGYFQMWISTFHSFADQILREEISHIGLNPAYKLLTQAETVQFLRNNLYLMNLKYFRPLSNPNKFLEGLLQHFSRLRDENISPEDYLLWAQKYTADDAITAEDKEKTLELAQAYKAYQDIKVKEGYFDFADLIYFLVELFRKRKNILEKYRNQFKYVLVDEFQDTNIAQYDLIKMLCPPLKTPRLTVVGDDSQAIYKFRGASVSNILQFMKDYPDSQQITLIHNYRSNQKILDTAYKLIKHNDPDTLEARLGITKELVAHTKNIGEEVRLNVTDSGEQESDFVAREILKLRDEHKYSFSDFAILVRANNHGKEFVNILNSYAIPFKFHGPGMLFKQPEVKDLIAYLKVLYNIDDSPSFFRVLCMDIFDCNQQDIARLTAFAKKTSLPLLIAAEVYCSFYQNDWFREEYENYRAFTPLLLEKTRTSLLTIISIYKRHMGLVKKDGAAQILYYFLEDTGYIKKIANYATSKEEKISNNIIKFFNKLKKFEADHEDASIFTVVDYLELSMELGESPLTSDTDVADYDGVNIYTAHGAKGLEFPVVFVVHLCRGRFPTNEKKEQIPIPQEMIKEELPEGNFHLLEERRLFYVAVTRAKDKLYLTSSTRYGAGKLTRKLSPFVVEALGEDEVNKTISIKKEEKEQLSIFDFKPKIDNHQEVPVKEVPTGTSNFSFTQLEGFGMCPLQYKYQYLLKIPTSPGFQMSFGDTIHKSLQYFYQDFLKDRSVDVEHLIATFKRVWLPVGYTSSAQEARLKKEGEKMLRRYYETFHHPNMTINALEKLFKIKVDFDLFITGKIDRIDDKGNGEIEIIDYKTGKTPDEKKLKNSLQLSIYALAAADPGLYNKALSQVTLTFYYLQDMKKVSMKRTPEEMAKVKDTIRETVQKIRTNQFAPNVGPHCNFCSFKIICEAWQ